MRFWNPFRRIRGQLYILNRKLEIIMDTLETRFTALEAKLDEASSEILAELQDLRDSGITPEAEAIIARIEAKVTALADVSPPLP